MKKILVPLDGSTLAEKVLPYAVLLAAHFKAELVLLRVVKGSGSHGNENDTERQAGEYLEQVKAIIHGEKGPGNADSNTVRLLVEQELESQSTGESLPYTASNQIAHGEVHTQIVQIANQIHADLIAMSTHGRSGFSRFFNGSVAQKVLHETNLPLLLIHPEHDTGSLVETFKAVPHNFMHRPVVVPLDGKPLAEAALPLAREIAGECRAPVTLLQIVSELPDTLAMAGAVTATGGLLGDPVEIEELTAAANKYLADVHQRKLADCSNVMEKVFTGDAPSGIVDYIQNYEAGFIVMVSHARAGFSRVTLGSVTDEVVRHTTGHPLIVVHSSRPQGHK